MKTTTANWPHIVPINVRSNGAAVAAAATAAFEYQNQTGYDLVINEIDIVAKLSAAVAPFPANYQLPRVSSSHATPGDVVLPTTDQLEIYDLAIVEAPVTLAGAGNSVPSGVFSGRLDRGILSREIILPKDGKIKGNLVNNTGLALLPQIVLKGEQINRANVATQG